MPTPSASVWKGASAWEPRCGVVVKVVRLTEPPSAIDQASRVENGVSPGQTGSDETTRGDKSYSTREE